MEQIGKFFVHAFFPIIATMFVVLAVFAIIAVIYSILKKSWLDTIFWDISIKNLEGAEHERRETNRLNEEREKRREKDRKEVLENQSIIIAQNKVLIAQNKVLDDTCKRIESSQANHHKGD